MIFRLLFSCIMMLLPFAACLGSNKDYGIVGNEVIAHYTNLGDKEKLRAAEFLVSNMQYHTFKHSPTLDRYYQRIEEINGKFKYPACVEQFNNLYKELGNPLVDIKVVKDADFMTSQDLINHIELAFDDWRNGTWARHLSFEDFCEYLLPYKLADEKPTKGWREELRKRFLFRAEGVKVSDDTRYSAYWASLPLNETLMRLGFNIYQVLTPEIFKPLSALKNLKMGECKDYAMYTAYVMRACGIPVSVDFTPQWPDRVRNHYWNTLLDNTGKSLTFMGMESHPGSLVKPGQRMAKVYRHVFAYQKQSLYALNQKYGENVPEILNNPFVKDVSAEYFNGKSLTVKLNDFHKNDRFVYIAVFDNQVWVPVDFAEITNERTATFHNMGCNIIYMPVYWSSNGSVPAGNPVLLNYDGTTQELNADTLNRQTITMSRKYPLFNRIANYRRLMKRGYFEASNTPDFVRAIKCATIKGVPKRGFDTLTITGLESGYRYWRYVPPKGKRCTVAELSFIKDGCVLPAADYIGAKSSAKNTGLEQAFDRNKLSYYESEATNGAWIGVDMGKKVRIDKIAYIPRNDDNDVVCSEIYELSYFQNGRQKSAGVKIAKTNELSFLNVPCNTVYILHNVYKGTEERLFTYVNNQIYWY